MKFLVVQYFKDSYFALPPEKRAQMTMDSFAFADKYIQNGGCKMVYNFADAKGNVSVWDVGSAEDLMRLSLEYPLTPYVDMEKIPIVEYDAASKIMKEAISAMQKAAPAMSR